MFKMIVTNKEWFDERKKIKRSGYYMDGYLKENLDGVPKFLKMGYDCVAIFSGHGKVRVGKTESKDTRITIIEDGKEKVVELGSLKHNQIIKLYSFDFKNNKKIITEAEVIVEEEEKDFYKLELEDGSIVKCSAEHRLFIKRGSDIFEKRLKDLKEGDEIICLT